MILIYIGVALTVYYHHLGIKELENGDLKRSAEKDDKSKLLIDYLWNLMFLQSVFLGFWVVLALLAVIRMIQASSLGSSKKKIALCMLDHLNKRA